MVGDISDQSAHPPAGNAAVILIIAGRGVSFFVQALEAFSALRMHHANDQIHLLVDENLVGFASLAPYFDTVQAKPKSLIGLARALKQRAWGMVYDFDCSTNTVWAHRLAFGVSRWLGGVRAPAWSGHLPGCQYPLSVDAFSTSHVSDRVSQQIRLAGVMARPPASFAWVSRAAKSFVLPFALNEPFVLLAIDSPSKGAEWPVDLLAECCGLIEENGQRPVLVGFVPRPDLGEAVRDRAPASLDMTGRVSLEHIVFLSWAAAGGLGYDNDTMHLIAAAGCRSVVMYDPSSDAALTGHRGPDVTILRRHRIDAIAPAEVVQKLFGQAVA